MGSRLTLPLLCALALPAAAGCVPAEGESSPLDRFYFPTGLAVSPAGSRLYVASSNFDLRYETGTLIALDLDRVVALVPRGCDADAQCGAGERCDLDPTEANGGAPSGWCVASAGEHAGRPCGALREQTLPERLLHPGRCASVSLTAPPGGGSLITGAVSIGSFATDVLLSSRPPGTDGLARPGARLFLPVRADATLTWIDVDDDSKPTRTGYELSCGERGADRRCDDDHRRGDDPAAENTVEARLPREPYGVAASADGRVVVLTHQTEGVLSLFANDWGEGTLGGEGPRLVNLMGDLPSRPVGITAVPSLLPDAEPRFWVAFRDAPQINLVRAVSDAAADPPRPRLSNEGAIGVTGNAAGFDSRSVAVDATERLAAEAPCVALTGDAYDACVREAHDVPLHAWVSNRSPSTLLSGQTEPGSWFPRNFDALPLSFGPSRVQVGAVIGDDGAPVLRVFVVCFDARAVYIVDPVLRVVEAIVDTGRGPHALAVDSARGLAYLAHFTDSYVGVIDLDRRRTATYGTVVLSLGRPTAPRASQ